MRKYLDPISQNKFGSSRIFRDVFKIPKWMPINAELQHGWLPHDIIFDKTDKTNVILVWSRRMEEVLQKNGFKKYFVITNPYISYRKKKYEKKNNAIGTVFFPQHTDEGWTATYNIDDLSKELLYLPKSYQPVTICLYDFDYQNKKVRSKFEENFKVVSAGNIYNEYFIDNFYNILCRHKYSASNAIGTYTFYSIELNIPFFVLDQDWGHRSKSNSKIKGFGRNDFLQKFPEYKKAHELFLFDKSGIINDKQKKYVRAEMGLSGKDPKILVQLILSLRGLWMYIRFVLNQLS